MNKKLWIYANTHTQSLMNKIVSVLMLKLLFLRLDTCWSWPRIVKGDFCSAFKLQGMANQLLYLYNLTIIHCPYYHSLSFERLKPLGFAVNVWRSKPTKKVRCLKTDNGLEFCSKEFQKWRRDIFFPMLDYRGTSGQQQFAWCANQWQSEDCWIWNSSPFGIVLT